MKIPIITDTHFGARNDSPVFMEYFMRFFDRVFFPWVEANQPQYILHLGDFLDRRKFVNFLTLNAVRDNFLRQLDKSGSTMLCILGNHDIFYKNKSEINSVSELFSKNENVVVFDKPDIIKLGKKKIALLPWINKDNEEESLKFIRETDAPILCGHLELHGYQVLRNTPFDGGMNADLFSKFEAVYTGHFHTRHSQGNIHYLGCPYQITMNDYGDKKGFHVLDTDTGELEFIPNPYTIFSQLRYDDTNADAATPITVDETRVKGKFVRVLVENKTKPYLFEKFIDSLYAHQPQTVTIIEDLSPANSVDETVDLTEDTITIINREIETLQNVDSSRLKILLRELYTETQALENTKQQ